MSAPRPIEVDEILRQLQVRRASRERRIAAFDSIDSTSSELKRRIASGKAGPGDLALATAQTAGRGRYGRTWISPPAGNLYASLAVAVEGDPEERVPLIPLAAGVAARDALASLGVDGVALKWPNDLSRAGRKIGGILCEAASIGALKSVVVVGIGINLGAFELDAEIADIAACLDVADRVTPELAAAAWTAELETWTRAISQGRIAELVAAWKERSEPFGRRVRVGDIVGRTVGLDAGGRLLVEADGGGVATIYGGIVEDAPPESVTPALS